MPSGCIFLSRMFAENLNLCSTHVYLLIYFMMIFVIKKMKFSWNFPQQQGRMIIKKNGPTDMWASTI